MRAPRSLRSQARARAQARRMTEMARVVREELREHGGGGEFHDLSSGYEMRWQPERIGFRIPDSPEGSTR